MYENEKGDGRPPWPEWSDEEINNIKWEDLDTGEFVDPSGEGLLPLSLKPHFRRWTSPSSFFKPPDSPHLLLEGDREQLDLITPNAHLCRKSPLLRFILAEISQLYDFAKNNPDFRVEGDGTTFRKNSNARWRPWHHIYSLNKAGHKGDLPKMNPMGRYFVRIYYLGAWRKITVDDRLPLMKNKSLGLPLSDRSELWPLILTKALIKVASLSWDPEGGIEVKGFSTVTCLMGWIHEWRAAPKGFSDDNMWAYLSSLLPKYIQPNFEVGEVEEEALDRTLALVEDSEPDFEGDSDSDESIKVESLKADELGALKEVLEDATNEGQVENVEGSELPLKTLQEDDPQEVEERGSNKDSARSNEASLDEDGELDEEKVDESDGKLEGRRRELSIQEFNPESLEKLRNSEFGLNRSSLTEEPFDEVRKHTRSKRRSTHEGKSERKSRNSSGEMVSSQRRKSSTASSGEKSRSRRRKSSDPPVERSKRSRRRSRKNSTNSPSKDKSDGLISGEGSFENAEKKHGSKKNSLDSGSRRSRLVSFDETSSSKHHQSHSRKKSSDFWLKTIPENDESTSSGRNTKSSSAGSNDFTPKSSNSDSLSKSTPSFESRRMSDDSPNLSAISFGGGQDPLDIFGGKSPPYGSIAELQDQDEQVEDAPKSKERESEDPAWDLSGLLGEEIKWDYDPNVLGAAPSSKKKDFKKQIPKLKEILSAFLKDTPNHPEKLEKLRPLMVSAILQPFPPKDINGQSLREIPREVFHPVHLVLTRDGPLLAHERLPPLPLWKTYRWKAWAQWKGIYPPDPPQSDPEEVIKAILLRSPFLLKDWGISEPDSNWDRIELDDGEGERNDHGRSGESFSTSIRFSEEDQAPLIELPRPSIILDEDMLKAFKKMRGRGRGDSDSESSSSSDEDTVTGLAQDGGIGPELIEEDGSLACQPAWVDVTSLTGSIDKFSACYSLSYELGSSFVLRRDSPPLRAYEEFDSILGNLEASLAMGREIDVEAAGEFIRGSIEDRGASQGSKETVSSSEVSEKSEESSKEDPTPSEKDEEEDPQKKEEGRGQKKKKKSKKKKKNKSKKEVKVNDQLPRNSKEKWGRLIENPHQKKGSKNVSIKFDVSKRTRTISEYHLKGSRGIDSAFYIFSDCWIEQELTISIEILQATSLLKFSRISIHSTDEGTNHLSDLPLMNLTLVLEPWDWRNDSCVKSPIFTISLQSNRIIRIPLPPGRNTLRLWLAQDLHFPKDLPYNSLFSGRIQELSPFALKVLSPSPIHLGPRQEVLNYMTHPPTLLLKQAEKLATCLWTLFSTFGDDLKDAKRVLSFLQATYSPSFGLGGSTIQGQEQGNPIRWKLRGIRELFHEALANLLWKLNGNRLGSWMILALRSLLLDPNVGEQFLKKGRKEAEEIQAQEDTLEENTPEEPKDSLSDERYTQAVLTIQKFFRGWRLRRIFLVRRRTHKHFPRVLYNLRKIALLLAENCDSKWSKKGIDNDLDGLFDLFDFDSLSPGQSPKPKLMPEPPKWALDLLQEMFESNPWLITTHPHAFCSPKHIAIREWSDELQIPGNSKGACIPFFQKAFRILPPTNELMCEIELCIPSEKPGWSPLLKIYSNDSYGVLPKTGRMTFLGRLPRNANGYTVRCYLEKDSQDEKPTLNPLGVPNPIEWTLRIITPHFQRNSITFDMLQESNSSF